MGRNISPKFRMPFLVKQAESSIHEFARKINLILCIQQTPPKHLRKQCSWGCWVVY